jgi:ferredoxin
MQLGRSGEGLPARMIPLPVHNIASIGLDLLLGALAYGASQCVILSQGNEPEAYLEATQRQLEIGNLILDGLGYDGQHLHLIAAGDAEFLGRTLSQIDPARAVREAAVFNLLDEKRSSLEFIFDHLLRQAPRQPETIALPAGAAYGTVHVDKAKCTLCMSCVGACPASALMDSADYPRLKFIERNCVQCGLCVKTCPEDAVTLEPRLLLTEEVRRERVLNEAEPFHCIKCGKPFGTRQMIDNMLGKLTGHSMFAGRVALRRLQMCADCRAIDMMENKNEMTIHDL